MLDSFFLVATELKNNTVADFIFLFLSSLAIGLADLFLWKSDRKTISERIWAINQWTLALAFLGGLLAGHLFTVPK